MSKVQPKEGSWQFELFLSVALPHGVQNGAVLHNAEKLVWRRHVVSD